MSRMQFMSAHDDVAPHEVGRGLQSVSPSRAPLRYFTSISSFMHIVDDDEPPHAASITNNHTRMSRSYPFTAPAVRPPTRYFCST